MAKKELTEFDIIKKQFSKLEKLNQRLKNIASAYYIAYDGTIYMKSLVNFIEKFVHVANPEEIDRFYGCMIMPNELFEFCKNAKKSKLTINATEKAYYFGQDDNDDVKFTINILNSNKDVDMSYIISSIRPKMYKRFFEIYEKTDMYHIYDDDKEFHPFTEIDVDDIASANPVFIKYNNTDLTITKHLLLDIKKSDKLSIARIAYVLIDGGMKRVFYMIKHECELYDTYTIFNTLQS